MDDPTGSKNNYARPNVININNSIYITNYQLLIFTYEKTTTF